MPWSAPTGSPRIWARPTSRWRTPPGSCRRCARDAKAEYARGAHPGRGLSSTSTTSPTSDEPPAPHAARCRPSSRAACAGSASATAPASWSTTTTATRRARGRGGCSGVFGHADVAVLDGGLAKWRAEGRPVDDAAGDAARGAFHGAPEPPAGARSGADARQPGEPARAGDRRPLAPAASPAPSPSRAPGLRGGHIPGSVSLPHLELIAPRRHAAPEPTSCAAASPRPASTRAADRHDLRLRRHRRHAGARPVRDRRAGRRGLRRLVDRMGRAHRHPGRDLRMTDTTERSTFAREGLARGQFRAVHRLWPGLHARARAPAGDHRRAGRLGDAGSRGRAVLRRRRPAPPAARAPARGACAGARRLAGHAGEDGGDLRRACATGWSCKRSISQRATGGDSQPAPDAICSSLAVHHLDGAGKRQLFKDLHAALRPGGIFVLADLIRPDSEAGWRIAAEDWDRAVAERSQQIYGDDRAQRRFAELRWNYCTAGRTTTRSIIPPRSPSTSRGLTRPASKPIELHWLLAGHAIFSARKP